jgi:hypothetical protein
MVRTTRRGWLLGKYRPSTDDCELWSHAGRCNRQDHSLAFVSWSPVAGPDSSSAYFFAGCGGAGGCSLLGGTMFFMRM